MGDLIFLLDFNQVSAEPSKIYILLGFLVRHFERVFVCCAHNNGLRKDKLTLYYIEQRICQ
jgi:uncharacterized metal-binding protein